MKWTLCLAGRLKIAWQIAIFGWSWELTKSKVKAVIRQATISKDEMD